MINPKKDQEETQIRIIKKESSGQGLFHFICKAPKELQESFQTAGQFARLRKTKKSGFFTLAGRPGQQYWEFLLKNQGEPAEELCSLEEYAVLHSTCAIGQGFPLKKILKHTGRISSLYLFSMGSALPGLRSVLLDLFAQNPIPISEVHLWQAASNKGCLPFSKEYAGWQKKGIQVHLCIDSFLKKNKNNIIERLHVQKPNLSQAAVCWGGSKEFGLALEKLCRELGLPAGAFLDNLSGI